MFRYLCHDEIKVLNLLYASFLKFTLATYKIMESNHLRLKLKTKKFIFPSLGLAWLCVV